MSISIHDPDTQKGMTVGPDGRAYTRSIIEPLDRHRNIEDGAVWSYSFDDINPAGATDFFFYITNTSASGARYMITDFRGWCTTTTGRMSIEPVTGTPSYVSGTDLTPVSRSIPNAKSPTITCRTDTDITGLTSGGNIFYVNFDTAEEERHLRTSSGIILNPGGALAFKWEPATGEISGVVSVVELEDV